MKNKSYHITSFFLFSVDLTRIQSFQIIIPYKLEGKFLIHKKQLLTGIKGPLELF